MRMLGSTNANVFAVDADILGFTRPAENRRVIDVRQGWQDEVDYKFSHIFKQSGGNETIGFAFDMPGSTKISPKIYAIRNTNTDVMRVVYEIESSPSLIYRDANPILDRNLLDGEEKVQSLIFPSSTDLEDLETEVQAASLPSWTAGTKWAGHKTAYVLRSLWLKQQSDRGLRFAITEVSGIRSQNYAEYAIYACYFIRACSMILKNHRVLMSSPLLLDDNYFKMDSNHLIYRP